MPSLRRSSTPLPPHLLLLLLDCTHDSVLPARTLTTIPCQQFCSATKSPRQPEMRRAAQPFTPPPPPLLLPRRLRPLARPRIHPNPLPRTLLRINIVAKRNRRIPLVVKAFSIKRNSGKLSSRYYLIHFNTHYNIIIFNTINHILIVYFLL